ncbi:hypothetical protein [Gordonia polyisoprenivorans]|uniref:hypothetical protein n=1 Tax=Gordonia polyisoprenivorans TaxID=84595 RepID=UPI002300E704|nr:hypothetical protein [Gordonia polyisoprenivorans]WCB37647.1 hypothetical protein PHA63_00310 [Gordonia polyisoprenivorans]
MLPRRSRLQSWQPEQLTEAADTVKAAGSAIETAAEYAAGQCAGLPEYQGWTGPAQTAAQRSFDQAKRAAYAIADAAEAVSGALTIGAHDLTWARSSLLDHVTAVETGDLWVNDLWVVLIRPKEYTSAALVALRKQRDSAQATTNTKLLAVGTADDSTANSLRAAAQSHAVTLPQAPTMMEAMINTSAAPPQDEVPNPAELTGQLRQGQIRDVDAATTIARVDTDTVINGSTTTVLMQDGGRTVITDRTTSAVGNDGVVEAGFAADDTLASHTETQYDPQGNLVVAINETRGDRSGTVATRVQTPSGGAYKVVAADGAKKGWTLNPDGTRNEDLPADAGYFTHQSETLFGAGMASMEVAAKNGHLEAGPIARAGIASGMKFGGPALSIAVAASDIINADNNYEACRALMSGVMGGAGGWAMGAAAAGVSAPAGPLAVLGAGAGAAAGTWVFGKAGDEIGRLVCPK